MILLTNTIKNGRITESPLNPTPGEMSLRHVGLLGAQRTVIKGLPAINFAETSSTTIKTVQETHALKRMLNWVVEKFGSEAASEAEEYLRTINETAAESDDSQEADNTIKKQTVCFTEVSAAPRHAVPTDDVAQLIKQAHTYVTEAQASGRTLGFVEAVTLAQQEK